MFLVSADKIRMVLFSMSISVLSTVTFLYRSFRSFIILLRLFCLISTFQFFSLSFEIQKECYTVKISKFSNISATP